MYYVLLISLCIILVILLVIIYKENLEIKKQIDINNDLKKNNNRLINIDKYQINYLKNGYKEKKFVGKVLLGDYDKYSMSNTIDVINKLGYDVDIVNCAEDILFKLKINKYDYVITNYQYKEGMNGIELCNRIKDLGIDTKAIILSSTTSMKDEFTKVCDYYIEKPLTKDKLKNIMNNK